MKKKQIATGRVRVYPKDQKKLVKLGKKLKCTIADIISELIN